MIKKYIEYEIKGTDEEILEALERTVKRFVNFEKIDDFYRQLGREIKQLRE
uniref:Uncharacterized protein n=1 Tax=viral metagenome TaxID=1070528 RepID=A0A6H2A670_9ZZZZ